MNSVTVEKEVVLQVIKANRQKHLAEYEEAIEGYRKELVVALQTEIAKLKGHLERVYDGYSQPPRTIAFTLPVPVSHVDDYDRVILMLEMCVDDEVDFEAYEFEQYVMDRWPWKEGFEATSSLYKLAK